MMESKKCFYKDSEIVRHINIHRDFLDMLMNEKGLNTYGDTLLFFYLRLSAQCYLSEGMTTSWWHKYAKAGEFVTTDKELTENFGLKSRKKMYEILERMVSLGLIQCEAGPKVKHRVVELFIRVDRAAECKSNKVFGAPKHGFLITDRDLLYQLIPEDGSTRFSDMDIFLSLWIHTVYNDIYVPVSLMLPVVVFNGDERTPLYSSRILCKHFNCSAPRVNNCIRSFIKCGILKTYNFSQSGYAIQPVEFARYMFGEDVETINDQEGMLKLYEKMNVNFNSDSAKFKIMVQEGCLDTEKECNKKEGEFTQEECNKKERESTQEECNKKERESTQEECNKKERESITKECKENLVVCTDGENSLNEASSIEAGCKEKMTVCSEDVCGVKTAAAPGYDWEKTDGPWSSAGDIKSSHEETYTYRGKELLGGFPIVPDPEYGAYEEADTCADAIYRAETHIEDHGQTAEVSENTGECGCFGKPEAKHSDIKKFSTTAAIVKEKRNGRDVRRIIFDRALVEQIMDCLDFEYKHCVVLSITQGVKKSGAGKHSGGSDEQEGTAITGGGG